MHSTTHLYHFQHRLVNLRLMQSDVVRVIVRRVSLSAHGVGSVFEGSHTAIYARSEENQAHICGYNIRMIVVVTVRN